MSTLSSLIQVAAGLVQVYAATAGLRPARVLALLDLDYHATARDDRGRLRRNAKLHSLRVGLTLIGVLLGLDGIDELLDGEDDD